MKIKKFLEIIWNEFVYGGHLLSLGAVSIVLTSAILLDSKITWDFLLIVYLGVQSIYLYDRYRGFKKDALTNPERTKHIEKYVKYIPLIILFFSFIIVAIVIYFNIRALPFIILMLLLGLFYSISLKKLTQKIVGFKTFFVSLMWALLVMVLAIYYSLLFNLALFFIFIFIFLKCFIIISFFDIKDIESDKKEGLLTLANVWGQKKLIDILKLITLLAIIPIILGFYLGLLPLFSLMLIFTIPYTFYYLKKSKDKKTDISFLNNVIADGEPILWLFLILFGKILL